jgi:hypothetical protein
MDVLAAAVHVVALRDENSQLRAEIAKLRGLASQRGGGKFTITGGTFRFEPRPSPSHGGGGRTWTAR